MGTGERAQQHLMDSKIRVGFGVCAQHRPYDGRKGVLHHHQEGSVEKGHQPGRRGFRHDGGV